MQKKPILLIAFYNKKALGVRYLERSLTNAGYRVYILFLKNFNSIKPEPVSDRELLLAKELVSELSPGLIGLSVMSSLYMESVITVSNMLREHFSIPVVWGGVYASLFPGKSLGYADFVLRGEGEEAIVDLADALYGNKDHRRIPNLAYRDPVSGEKIIINEPRPLCTDLDQLGYPIFDACNKFYIENDRITNTDPMMDSFSYELSASRGCPFTCTYCSSINLKRLYKGQGRYVRFRSVSSIISELEEALESVRNLRVIHFWDEIFPDDKLWTDQFAHMYKSRIGLPFEIWAHPLRCSEYTISKLTDAGLHKVVMGIQSGSPRIRSDIFRRRETQTDIIKASEVLSRSKVPHVVYDFILRHPFENEDDIRQTYELCTKLARPFDLQLHGLNFFPGTDIIDIALRHGITVKISESGPTVPMREAYKSYWGQKNSSRIINFWYSLIYLSQFRLGLPVSKLLSRSPGSKISIGIALLLQELFRPVAKLRHYYRKGALLLRSVSAKSKSSGQSRQIVQYEHGK